MQNIKDNILSYREMCDEENVQTLQRGMNFRLNPSYSVILMSQRSNAPYRDRVNQEDLSVEYEGHDINRRDYNHNPKFEDQVEKYPNGKLTQNGLFIDAIEKFKENKSNPEVVKIYEKIMSGVWSLKGYFELVNYEKQFDGNRNVFKFKLRLSKDTNLNFDEQEKQISHTRLIPSAIKKEVWKRDGGKCVICGAVKNLHFDHDLPFSKGGTSLTTTNIKLMCMKHNLRKSAQIE